MGSAAAATAGSGCMSMSAAASSSSSTLATSGMSSSYGFGLVHERDDVLDVLRRGGGRAGDQLLLEGWGRPGPAHDTGADDLDGDTPGPVLGRGVEGQDGVARDGPNLRDDVTTADPSAHVVDGVVVVEADQAAVVAVEPSDRPVALFERRA